MQMVYSTKRVLEGIGIVDEEYIILSTDNQVTVKMASQR